MIEYVVNPNALVNMGDFVEDVELLFLTEENQDLINWYHYPIPVEEKKIKMGNYPIDNPTKLKRVKNV